MKPLRPSSLIIALWALLGFALAFCLLDAWLPDERIASQRVQNRALVARLGLTDLALMTEARYTRHPTQTDLHSAFQDHPMAQEHFPTGSLIAPPYEFLARTPTRAD